MTNFRSSGVNPLQANLNAPQQNRQTESSAQELPNSSVPEHHTAGLSGTQPEERPQNQLSAADTAIHGRARFFQQQGNVAARADPVEQEWADILPSLPRIIPDMPELDFSSQPQSVPVGAGDRHGKRPALEPQAKQPAVRQRTDSNVAARTNVPAGSTVKKPPPSWPQILKSLVPYAKGESLTSCEVIPGGYKSLGNYFYGSGGLKPRGQELFDKLEASDQEKIRKAIADREATKPVGGQSSQQGNVQNAAAAAQADPVEQEWADILPSLPRIIPDMPELDFSSQPQSVPVGAGDRHGKRPALEPQAKQPAVRQRTDSNVAAQTDVPAGSSTKKKPPKAWPQILKSLEPYAQGMAIKDCEYFPGGFQSFGQHFYAAGGLTSFGEKNLFDRLEASDQETIQEAIKARRAVLERGQSS